MLKFALIVGSTRPNRFADHPAQWIVKGAAGRTDFTLELLDLREADLPLFEEPTPPSRTKGVFSNPKAEAWRKKLGEYDGFIATAAEYNHGPTAVLKNAFDSAFLEWVRKPIGFVGYGGTGGVRSVEQLRQIVVELQMAPVRAAVHIGMEPFLAVSTQGKSLDDFEALGRSRTALFNDMAWWGAALKTARAATPAPA